MLTRGSEGIEEDGNDRGSGIRAGMGRKGIVGMSTEYLQGSCWKAMG